MCILLTNVLLWFSETRELGFGVQPVGYFHFFVVTRNKQRLRSIGSLGLNKALGTLFAYQIGVLNHLDSSIRGSEKVLISFYI